MTPPSPALVPTPPLPVLPALLLAALVFGWWTARRLRAGRAKRLPCALFSGLSVLMAAAAARTGYDLLGRYLSVDAAWAAWPLALFTGAAVEAVLLMYRRERQSVARRGGLALAALRVALLLLVSLMLIQPSCERTRVHTHERYVAVLVDRSASMAVRDRYGRADELFETARLFDAKWPAVVPPAYGVLVSRLAAHAGQLEAQAGWLEYVRKTDFDTLRLQLGRRRAELRDLFRSVAQTAREQADAIDALMLEPGTGYAAATQEVKAVRAALTDQVAASAAAALRRVEEAKDDQLARELAPLIEALRALQQKLSAAAAAAAALPARLAEARYAALPEAQKKLLGDAVARPREEVVRAVLAGRPDGRPGLLAQLGEKYALRTYVFAADARETNLAAWAAGPAPDRAPADALATDLAAALESVEKDLPAHLSGILLLTDGRGTGRGDAEAVARRLAGRRVPVCAVAVGSQSAPLDAAVLSAEAPDTVIQGDRLRLRASLKLDQMTGQTARVTLKLNGQVVDEKALQALTPDYRTVAEFSHTPTNKGVNVYSLAVDAVTNEQVLANNALSFGVAVTDARSKLLVIDGRPRWEARYLRSLFAGRDAAVQLQYLLLEPDRVGSAPAAIAIPASADRLPAEVEATALPREQAEWDKFDMIVLGDAARAGLGEPAARALQHYVGTRGGTLVLIAGPHHLPAEYAGSPIEELFPLTFAPPAASPGLFRIRLTDEGAGHPILRLADPPESNRNAWDAIPELDWRAPVRDAKPGATVLAYAAEPAPRPAAAGTNAPAEEAGEEAAVRRREAERRNALVAVQLYGAGKVLMLSFDRTWRLRYRVGDAYHHKLWGQIARWAAEDKLPAGSAHVRLGTDRFQYRPGQPIAVKALLTDVSGAPIRTEDAFVQILRGGEAIARRKLEFVAGSAGRYAAAFDPLPADNRYRVELKCAEADRVLAREGVPPPLATEFAVVPDASAELGELRAARAPLARLADLTGGTVVAPAAAPEAAARFGEGIERTEEITRYALWNSWPLLLLLFALAAAEWVLRKRMGLI